MSPWWDPLPPAPSCTNIPLFWSHCTTSSGELITTPTYYLTLCIPQLLQVSPSERIGAGSSGVEELKAHPFFSSIDWTNVWVSIQIMPIVCFLTDWLLIERKEIEKKGEGTRLEETKPLNTFIDCKHNCRLELRTWIITRKAELIETENNETFLNETQPGRQGAMVTYQVWAVGSLLWAGTLMMVNGGLRSLNPPGGSWEHPVTNWSSLAISSSVNPSTTDQNQDKTESLGLVITRACSFKSS